jgi:IS1 family transposase
MKVVRGVKAQRVQCDEIWSFTYAKQKNVPTVKAAPEEAGDTWTWMALDAETKLIVSWLVGGRDTEYASAFMNDLASRLGRV